MLYILSICYTDFTLQSGTLIQLQSHNYPSKYPPDAYVLWTFQLDSTDDDIVYHISYDYYVLIQNGDLLAIGNGWDTNDPLSVIVSYQGYYNAYPGGVVIPSRYIYIEFDADSASEWSGFQLSVNVRNITGEMQFSILPMTPYQHSHSLFIFLQNAVPFPVTISNY